MNCVRFFGILACLLSAQSSLASQWLDLTPEQISGVQLVEPNNATGFAEGLYISLNTPLAGEAATYCVRKDAVALTNSKLVDRAYSALLLSTATKKTVRFFINASGDCVNNMPGVSSIILTP